MGKVLGENALDYSYPEDPGDGSLFRAIPEPSTFAVWSLLGALGITVGWWRRRRREAA